MKNSRVWVQTERSFDNNSAVISNMRVKGFDSSEYDNKKIKKFHVEFDVE